MLRDILFTWAVLLSLRRPINGSQASLRYFPGEFASLCVARSDSRGL